MSLNKQKILGVQVTTLSREEVLEQIKKYFSAKVETKKKTEKGGSKPLTVVTPNPEQVIYAQHHTRFLEMLNQADIALPDGVGLLWASRFLSENSPNNQSAHIGERIAGVEFMEDLVALSAKQGVRIGLIGGREGIAVKALECLQKKHPELKGWAVGAPELSVCEKEELVGLTSDWIDEMIQKIRSTNVGMVFVGLGAPKQEYVIQELSERLGYSTHRESSSVVPQRSQKMLFMAVGGSLDFVSSTIQRAPLLIRSIGLEWLWRLGKEPWRWRRQLALLEFSLLVMREKVFSFYSRPK